MEIQTEGTSAEVFKQVSEIKGSSDGKKEDGTRVHIHYSSFGEPTEQAKVEAKRASDLGLKTDRYTGRVAKIWESKAGDKLLTLIVELERDKKYRTFNLNKGVLHNIVVLGD